jgi:DNA-directed RNA polymerase specialized sigma24 family protein
VTRQQARDLYDGCTLILALAELTDVQREAVVGHTMRGETLVALAKRRNVTPEAVRSCHMHGLAHLADLLAPERETLAA